MFPSSLGRHKVIFRWHQVNCPKTLHPHNHHNCIIIIIIITASDIRSIWHQLAFFFNSFSLVRFPNPLTTGSGLGFQYPKKWEIFLWGLPARPFGNAQGWEGAYWVSTAVGYPWHQHWISTFQPVLCSGPFKSSSQSSLRPPPNPHFADTAYLLLDFSLPPFIFLFNGILFSFADRWLSFCWCLRESPWSMAQSHHQTKPNRTLYN